MRCAQSYRSGLCIGDSFQQLSHSKPCAMAEQFLTQHDQSRLLLVIPRYASAVQYGYILPLGILYVSAAIKESGVCPVFTVNLNHQTDDDATVIRNLFAEHRITHVGTTGISGQFSDVYPLLRLVNMVWLARERLPSSV